MPCCEGRKCIFRNCVPYFNMLGHRLVPVSLCRTGIYLLRPLPLPRGLFFLYYDTFTSFSHLKSLLLTTGLLHLLLIGVTVFVFRFTNDTLEKFLLRNSRHARSGEMRRRLPTTAVQNLSKSDYQLMQPQTLIFLTTLDSKHVKTPLQG